jgi:acyl-CoA synthetase (AMP-forming)/AMP-acid ligase II
MSVRTIYDVLEEAVTAYGDAPALQQPRGKGEYQTWTWTQYRDAVREIACGLRRFGVQKGDIVAIYCVVNGARLEYPDWGGPVGGRPQPSSGLRSLR